MFTGIIAAIGRIVRIEPVSGDLRLRIATPGLELRGFQLTGFQPTGFDLTDVGLGDSIATNGVCLTVTRLEPDGFWADVSNETACHSTLAALPVGAPVNLEKALQFGGRLGGHLVSGHVDGVGEIIARREESRSLRTTVRAPQALAHYIAAKGSICVDGVSLTVNAVSGAEFELNIVPHTARGTIMTGYRAGHRVNLEIDIIARYLERLLGGRQADADNSGQRQDGANPSAAGHSGLSLTLLEQSGFLPGA